MGSERWPCLIWSRLAAWNATAGRRPKLCDIRKPIFHPLQTLALRHSACVEGNRELN
jgi:hypothetical protein